MESGVPTVKAPFNTPVKKATPLPHPVPFCQSFQTKELLACFFGMEATTIIVIRPPPITRNKPKSCSLGIRRLKKIQKVEQKRVRRTNATYVCHD
jgi:hypothetical protein